MKKNTKMTLIIMIDRSFFKKSIMPKYLATILSCSLIFNFSYGQQGNKQSIVIESINFYTKTIAAISCNNFESELGPMITRNLVTAKDSMTKLENFIANVKYLRDNEPLDARAKFIYVSKAGKKISICMNLFDICVQGRKIEQDTAFFNFLKSLVPKNQLVFKHGGSNNQ